MSKDDEKKVRKKPNRKRNRKFGCYFDDREYELIANLAESENVTMTDIIAASARMYQHAKGYDIDGRPKGYNPYTIKTDSGDEINVLDFYNDYDYEEEYDDDFVDESGEFPDDEAYENWLDED